MCNNYYVMYNIIVASPIIHGLRSLVCMLLCKLEIYTARALYQLLTLCALYAEKSVYVKMGGTRKKNSSKRDIGMV